MKSAFFSRAAFGLSLSLSMATAAHTAEYTIALPELLNRPAANELVTFPFGAKKGECKADSVRVTGANVPVAAYPNRLRPRYEGDGNVHGRHHLARSGAATVHGHPLPRRLQGG